MKIISLIFALFIHVVHANNTFTETKPSFRCYLPLGYVDEPSERGFDFMEEQIEIWKDIAGYEGFYQVSSFGRVKSLPRNVNIKDIHAKPRMYPGKILMPAFRSDYLFVQLCKGDMAKSCTVHRLVAQAFIPNPENKAQVNHKNGIKTCNYWWNLEWTTSSENLLHAHRIGLKKSVTGEDCGLSKLLEHEVLAIRDDIRPCSKISIAYGVDISHIYKIKRKDIWKHL